MTSAPADDFFTAAQAAMDEFPETFDSVLSEIFICVAEDNEPTHPGYLAYYASHGFNPGIHLSGTVPATPLIYLYPDRIKAYADTVGAKLEDVIFEVLLHEIAHHLHIPHEDMDRYRKQAWSARP